MASIIDKSLQAQEELRTLMTPVQPQASTTDEAGVSKGQRIIIPTQGGDVIRNEGDYAPPIGQTPSVPVSGDFEPDTNSLPEPTPKDTLLDRLNARSDQSMQALKDKGFDGYTPDFSEGGGNFTPEESDAAIRAITDVAAGFNLALAKGLSLPRETVDRGLAMLGLDYLESGRPSQHTVDALNRMGIPAYEVETLANKIGRGSLPAIATWAAMQVAGPSLAMKQGTSAASIMVRGLGEWIAKHPVANLWFGQTASAGGETAVHMTGKDNFPVRFGGEMLGAAAPSAAIGAAKLPFRVAGALIPGTGPAVRALGRGIGAGVDKIADSLPLDLKNVIKKYNPLYQQVPSEPLVSKTPTFKPDDLNTFSRDQLTASMHQQDMAIENAINSIPNRGTPAQLSQRTHDLLQNAEKISKRIVSSYWKRVPLQKEIDAADIRRGVISMRKELVDSDNVRPDDLLARVWQAVAPRQEPGSGKIFVPTPRIAKLRDLQSQIGTAITEERARDAPREGMVRNLTRLSEIIDDGIANALPNNTSIAQARAMSRRHNDLFSRGPVDEILSKRRSQDFRVPKAEAVDTLLTRTDGLQALKNVQEGIVNYPQAPFIARATQAEKAQLDEMIKAASDAIRASFREVAEQGPQKAVAYAQKNEDAIRSLGSVGGELQFAAQKISAALASQKEIQKSALARFAEFSGDKAVANIFAQKNPSEVAQQLMLSFRGDPDALAGLRNELLRQFIYERAKANPNIMTKMLQDPKTGNLMKTVLDSAQYARLNRMIEVATRIGAENEQGVVSFFKAPVKTSSRIVGAMIGRRVAGGTLQGPSLFSNAFGKWAEGVFQGTKPDDLLAQAVLDPHWERLLYSRNPTSTVEARRVIRLYKTIYSGMDSAQKAALERFSRDEGND